MSVQIEVRYLVIDWLAPAQARSVQVSDLSIRIEPGCNDDVPELELEIFRNDFAWLGLRALSKSVELPPRWESGDGISHQFIPVEDPQGAIWWVPVMEWVEQDRRHLNPFMRSLGKFDINLGPDRLRVRTITHDRHRLVIEDYLRTFKDELIWLVFGFEGSGGVQRGSQGEELVAAFEAFTQALTTVMEHLTSEIREVGGMMPRHKIRPNVETFRYYARDPHARHLPGRQSIETADLPDNRYLRYLAGQCLNLIQTISGVVLRRSVVMQRQAYSESKRAKSYEEIEYHDVDPAVFDTQLQALEAKLEEIRNVAYGEVEKNGGRVHEFPLKLTNRFADNETEFFYNRLDGRVDGQEVAYNVVRLSPELASPLFKALHFSKEYIIKAQQRDVVSEIRKNAKGKSYRFLNIKRILGLELKTSSLDKKRQTRIRLEKNGWRAPLKPEERSDYQIAARRARMRAENFAAVATRAKGIVEKLSAVTTVLSAFDKDMEKRGIGKSSTPPTGMRFSMNPKYAACLKAYRQVKFMTASDGMSEEALAEVEDFSTLHASAIYERWCFVKILTVLMLDYRFEGPANWKEKLINKATGQQESLTLDFSRPELGLIARVEYQVQLRNGRRPDFRLSFGYLSDDGVPVFSDNSVLILDAKFRTHWRFGELQETLDALVAQKQYDLDGGRVFVLQPVGKSVNRLTSPLLWGRDCDYGQVGKIKHKYGFIWISPNSGDGDENQHLRRLIALQLQDSFEAPPKQEGNFHHNLMRINHLEAPVLQCIPHWIPKSFCISCGAVHRGEDVSFLETKKGNTYWKLRCGECNMTSTRTHCYKEECGCVIFKNHTTLTYHNTVADQPTNVVCPACEAYFDQDWRDQSLNG